MSVTVSLFNNYNFLFFIQLDDPSKFISGNRNFIYFFKTAAAGAEGSWYGGDPTSYGIPQERYTVEIFCHASCSMQVGK